MNAKEFLEEYSINDLNVYGRHEEHYLLDNLLDEYAKQYKWINVKTLPEKKEERYQCIAEVHPRKESFYENNYAIVQDWVIRQHPENFIRYIPLNKL